jgi:predicted RNA-binding protein with TRAM domain
VPPRTGEIIELTIDGLAYGGQGVGRVDDFVVFVRRAVPGDRVRAQIVKRKRSYAEARLLEIVASSALRVPPACAHEAGCGGCEWQTLDYAAQLDFKQRQVVESLEHIGGLRGLEVEPIRGMEHPWRYRNKMEYSFGSDENGRLLLGLHKRGSWREIIEIEDCWLAPVEVNRAQAVAPPAAPRPPTHFVAPHEGAASSRAADSWRRAVAEPACQRALSQEEELAAESPDLRPTRRLRHRHRGRGPTPPSASVFTIAGPPTCTRSLLVPRTSDRLLQTNSACARCFQTALRWRSRSGRPPRPVPWHRRDLLLWRSAPRGVRPESRKPHRHRERAPERRRCAAFTG